jgi:hypothetical protein
MLRKLGFRVGSLVKVNRKGQWEAGHMGTMLIVYEGRTGWDDVVFTDEDDPVIMIVEDSFTDWKILVNGNVHRVRDTTLAKFFRRVA